MERLDKRLADTGRWSRKEARALVRAGRVAAGGAVCRSPEEKVAADAAGQIVSFLEKRVEEEVT